jgi:hypothetical protein
MEYLDPAYSSFVAICSFLGPLLVSCAELALGLIEEVGPLFLCGWLFTTLLLALIAYANDEESC